MMELVKTFLTHFTYLALIAVLLAAGVGVPIPEDVPLAFSGYLCNEQASPIGKIDSNNDGTPDTRPAHAQKRVPNLYLMIVAGMVGVLTGDTFVFYVGRHGIDSNNFIAKHLRKVLHSKRREKVERHFHKHGALTVFAGRFMPGLRSLVFGMAGMSQMKYWRFIIIDGIAAAISVPVFVLLGHHFADEIDQFLQFIGKLKHIVLPIFVAFLAIVICIYLVRRSRRIAAEKLALAVAKSPSPPPVVTASQHSH